MSVEFSGFVMGVAAAALVMGGFVVYQGHRSLLAISSYGEKR